MSQNPKYKIALKSPMHETSFWEEKNPTLPKGQVGIEISNEHGKLAKVGDGVHSWTNLPYINSIVGKKIAQHSEVFNDYVNNETNIPFAHIEGRNNKAVIRSFPVSIVSKNKIIFKEYSGDSISAGDVWNMFYRGSDSEIYRLRGYVEEFDEYSSETELYFYAILKCDDEEDLTPFIGTESINSFLMSFFVRGGTLGTQELSINDVPYNYTVHMEGYNNIGYLNTHVTGARNKALGYNSMAHGFKTEALGERSSTKGYKTIASGHESDAKGQQTKATGYCASSKGSGTTASGLAASAEGSGTIASGDESHSRGISTEAIGRGSTATGNHTIASGEYSFTMGNETKAIGPKTVAMGEKTEITGDNSVGCGKNNKIYNVNSFICGQDNITHGGNSIASGSGNTASGNNSFVTGKGNTASGEWSFVAGENSIATSRGALAAGINVKAGGIGAVAHGTKTLANGKNCLAIGDSTEAYNESSSAEGLGTKAGSSYQHVQGKYNKVDWGSKYAHIVGNGTADNARSNAHTLDWQGNAWFAGDVTIKNNERLATESYVDDEITLIESDIYDVNAEITKMSAKIEELMSEIADLKSKI